MRVLCLLAICQVLTGQSPDAKLLRAREIRLELEGFQKPRLQDFPHIKALAEEALALIDSVPGPQSPQRRLLTRFYQSWLGMALLNLEEPDPATNLEGAIHLFQEALSVSGTELLAVPSLMDRRALKLNLATALQLRLRGPREQNLDQAERYSREVLYEVNSKTDPYLWAGAQNLIGLVYQQRRRGNLEENREKAIRAFEMAQTVPVEVSGPDAFSRTEQNLGQLYEERTVEGHAENIEKSIAHLNRARELRATMPDRLVRTDISLSKSYLYRAYGDSKRNEELAQRYAEEALNQAARRPDKTPRARAEEQLCVVFKMKRQGELAENSAQAVMHCRAAVVLADKRSRNFWTQVRTGLAEAYVNRVSGPRLEDAASAIELLQEVLPSDIDPKLPGGELPLELGEAHDLMGRVLSRFGKGERTATLQSAAQHFRAALEIRTPERDPINRASSREHLAEVLMELQRRTGKGSVEAIQLLEQNLTFYTDRKSVV